MGRGKKLHFYFSELLDLGLRLYYLPLAEMSNIILNLCKCTLEFPCSILEEPDYSNIDSQWPESWLNYLGFLHYPCIIEADLLCLLV